MKRSERKSASIGYLRNRGRQYPNTYIDKILQDTYAQVLTEPVPKRLKDLVERLRKAEAGCQNS